MKKIISILLMMLAYAGVFAKTQVKFFEDHLAYRSNTSYKYEINPTILENKINNWLKENPKYRIINVSVSQYKNGWFTFIVCVTYDDGE